MTTQVCHRDQCLVGVNTVDEYIAWHILQLNLQPKQTKYKVNEPKGNACFFFLLKITFHTSSSRIELMLQILPNTNSAILSDPRGRDCVGREYHYVLFLFFGSNASQSLAQGLFWGKNSLGIWLAKIISLLGHTPYISVKQNWWKYRRTSCQDPMGISGAILKLCNENCFRGNRYIVSKKAIVLC